MRTGELLETFAAALLFAFAFLGGKRFHLPLFLFGGQAGASSFGAGMSIAYVFVRAIPELNGVRRVFAEVVGVPARYEGMAIYFVALLGFLLFYAFEHLRPHRWQAETHREEESSFRIHLGGFIAYVLLISYLLVRNVQESPRATVLYAVAIAFHLRAVDYSLRSEHGRSYERVGVYLLAAAALVGWGLGVAFALPRAVTPLLLAFLSGAIVVNSTVLELSSERPALLWPFVIGGITYGLILLPLG